MRVQQPLRSTEHEKKHDTGVCESRRLSSSSSWEYNVNEANPEGVDGGRGAKSTVTQSDETPITFEGGGSRAEAETDTHSMTDRRETEPLASHSQRGAAAAAAEAASGVGKARLKSLSGGETDERQCVLLPFSSSSSSRGKSALMAPRDTHTHTHTYTHSFEEAGRGGTCSKSRKKRQKDSETERRRRNFDSPHSGSRTARNRVTEYCINLGSWSVFTLFFPTERRSE